MKKQLTSIDIFINSSTLNTLGCLLRGLRFQTLADIAKAAVIHSALERVAFPPEATHVSVSSNRNGGTILDLHVVAVLGVPVSVSRLTLLSSLRALQFQDVNGDVGSKLERMDEAG